MTDTQTRKQTYRDRHKETDKQAQRDRQTGTERQTNMHTVRQPDTQ